MISFHYFHLGTRLFWFGLLLLLLAYPDWVVWAPWLPVPPSVNLSAPAYPGADGDLVDHLRRCWSAFAGLKVDFRLGSLALAAESLSVALSRQYTVKVYD